MASCSWEPTSDKSRPDQNEYKAEKSEFNFDNNKSKGGKADKTHLDQETEGNDYFFTLIEFLQNCLYINFLSAV